MTNAKAGRPTQERGKALTVYLRPSQVTLLKYIGDGKVSCGITKLIDLHAEALLIQAKQNRADRGVSSDNRKD